MSRECPGCGGILRIVQVQTYGAQYDPDEGAYQQTYRYGIARCEDANGDLRCGVYEGWTGIVEKPGDTTWEGWRRTTEAKLPGC